MTNKKCIIAVLGLLFLSPSCLFAVDFDVEFPPPCGPNGTYPGNIYIKILVDNNDLDRQYFRLPLVIYSWGNTIDHVIYLDVDGYGTTESINLLNGFEPGGFWETGVQIHESIMDGNLPDSFCFYVENSTPGDVWPQGLGSQEYIILNMNVDGTMWPYDFVGTICIDSTGFEDPYNWLWENPSPPFNGPFCVNLSIACAIPPTIIQCPTSLISTSYRKHLFLTFHALDHHESSVTEWEVYGPGTITPTSQFSATYEYIPVPEDYWDTLTVSICAATQWFPTCPGASDCTFEIYVRGPVCGDANDDGDFNLLDILYLISSIYDNPPGDINYDPQVVDVNSDGNINLIDVLLMIQNLYGPGSVELNCTFD